MHPKRPRRGEPTEESGDSIEDYWADLRRGPRRGRRTKSAEVYVPPPLKPLIDWTLSPTPAPIQVVPGPTSHDRQMLVAEFERGEWRRVEPGILFEVHGATRWLEEGVLPDVTSRVGGLTLGSEAREQTKSWFPPLPGSWELFWGLVAVEEFVIEEPLRGMVDQSFYLAHDVYRALWEVRFLAKEYGGQKGPAPAISTSIIRWLKGADLDDDDREVLTSIGIKRTVQSEQQRLDVLCFLLTLAVQNGLLSRFILFFDSLEEALTPARRSLLRQLHAFIAGITRWNRIGPPAIGVLIGFSPTRTNMSTLRRYHTKFHADVEAGLLWTKGTL